MLNKEQARTLRELAMHFSRKKDKFVSKSSVLRHILDQIESDAKIKDSIFKGGVK